MRLEYVFAQVHNLEMSFHLRKGPSMWEIQTCIFGLSDWPEADRYVHKTRCCFGHVSIESSLMFMLLGEDHYI